MPTPVHQNRRPPSAGGFGLDPPFRLERTVSASQAKAEGPSLPTEAVVKVHVSGVRPDYLIPWQVHSQESCYGSGFALAGRRILTNAHVVEDATVIQVTKQEDPKKFVARAVCVAHDIDLAIVEVVGEEAEDFWADMETTTFASDLPELYSEVKAVGFPSSGSTVCVTKGVISRIDAHLYAHPRSKDVMPDSRNSPGSVIILQVDAAINPGNSGGPAFDKMGRVVGVASASMSRQQNVGYVIPAEIAKMFIAEYDQTGAWSGVMEPGIRVRQLENDSMRRFLKMGSEKGVLVTEVAPLSMLHGKVQPGDVLTHVDDVKVTNESKVLLNIGKEKVYVAAGALMSRKPKGQPTKFRILRDGEATELTVTLQPIPPVAPRFNGYDSFQDFVLVGGIIFTRGTVPLCHDYLEARRTTGYKFISDSAVWEYFDAYKKDEDYEVVVLLSILKHDVNLGYSVGPGVLDTFNGQPVKNLRDLARMVGEALVDESEEFLCFSLRSKAAEAEAGLYPEIVLERARVVEADKQICRMNHIPARASPKMLPHLEAAMKQQELEDKAQQEAEAMGLTREEIDENLAIERSLLRESPR